MEATDVRCKHCGKTFPLLASEAAEGDGSSGRAADGTTAECPHCGESDTYTEDDVVAGES